MTSRRRLSLSAASPAFLFVLIMGSIWQPFVKSSTDTDQGLFFTGIAFLAGFSERQCK